MTDVGTHQGQGRPSDDPLDSELTFDDATMLGFAAIAIVTAVVLLVFGF